MTLDALAGRLSPDVPQTLRRFPLAIVLTGLATLVVIANLTELITDDQETWGRVIMGLATGAIFATGGRSSPKPAAPGRSSDWSSPTSFRSRPSGPGRCATPPG